MTDEHTPIDALVELNHQIWNEVDGWVGDRIFIVLRWMRDYFKEDSIQGDIVEIGVHHGKFLIGCSPLLMEGERAVAIDIWEDQNLNVDNSGCGSKSTFLKHWENFAPDAEVRVISGDSMALSVEDIRQEMSRPKCKFFSVDGGHTPSHVINDLKLAQELMVSGGVVALDDFLGPGWPTVTEGLFDYLAYHNVKLAPFLVFQNKLWLTTFSEHAKVLESAASHFEPVSGNEWFVRWRYSHIKGWKVLTFA